MDFEKVLVLCAGNICRSPMAEALLKHRHPHIHIQSAGLLDIPQQPADEKAIISMLNINLDIRSHVSKQVTNDLVKQFDLILVMSSRQKNHLEELFPFVKGKVFRLGHWQNKDVADPFGKSQEVFDHTSKLIDEFIEDWKIYFKA
ncbi:low molecular weight phosphotyrosine protein phosphatase [Acinetobacter sp. A3.8]|uniref:protein-tyrosine-phosphatase n=1 Tax=Acinetobacter sedimenti TaxID=2919922 RepID=A0A9X2B656_9GAMM|nr:low molecular weight phosphotyrosine protein phosphatase [Acinetobacter sedimenti]MCJ8146348.1 low molecular weight phosphotyrosine protein phosphatase [Acinetobacter sedimenti]